MTVECLCCDKVVEVTEKTVVCPACGMGIVTVVRAAKEEGRL